MKTLGCLWPPSALERWKGRGGALDVGRVLPLGEHDPAAGNILMLSLSRQEGRRDKLGNSPDLPSTEVGKSWHLWEGEGWKAGFSTRWVMEPARSPQDAGRERELQELAEVEVSTQAFISPMGNA